MRVQSFTDATPVRALAAVPPFAFAATDGGLDRWDLRTGKRLQLSAEHGLPGEAVLALGADRERDWLWVATDAGLSRYDVAAATFTEVAPAPQVLQVGPLAGATLEAAGDGGVWLGLTGGLYYASVEGGWTNTGVTGAVHALHRDARGALWIGTDEGLLVTGADRVARALGPAEGCSLRRVTTLLAAPGDGDALAVGEGPGGEPRVAIAEPGGCTTYRMAPPDRWDAAVRQGDRVVVLAGRTLYALGGPARRGPRRLARDGARLVPVPGARLGGGAIDLVPLPVEVSADAEVLAATDDEILLGTRTLGTMRVPVARAARVRWLRRGELAADARLLSVACAAENDCLIATGTRRLWHFDGEVFRDVAEDGERSLGVVRGPDGTLYVLRSREGEPLRIAARRGGVFEELPGVAIETPGGAPELSFARFSPSGVLWLGLGYLDEAGERRPFGAALVDLSLSVVVYHHASADEGEQARGILPIPIGVVGACFVGNEEAWLATSQGAARVVGQDVRVFTEADGLRAEILRGVACSAGGMVHVASRAGVGTYDGESWRYSRALRTPVNDLDIGPDGRLWMATDRGLAAFDGARLRRLDARRGLLEDRIREADVDDFGRVWVLGDEGVGLVRP